MLRQLISTALATLAFVSPALAQEPGTPYCYGVNCPCGNDDPTAGCANSSGQGGLLNASGSTSVAADDIHFTASQLARNQVALLVISRNQSNFPFHSGRMCIGPNLVRFRKHLNSGQSGSVTYINVLSTFAYYGTTIASGETWNAQVWYRDSSHQGLCDAAHSTNLTNGYQLTFTP